MRKTLFPNNSYIFNFFFIQRLTHYKVSSFTFAAKQGIKIVEDFSHITENEEKFKFLFQCVEDHRKSLPSFKQSECSPRI